MAVGWSTRRRVKAGLAFALALVAASAAHAMQFTAVPLGSGNSVLVLAEGEIVPGDLQRLIAFMGGRPQNEAVLGVLLDSPGGALLEADKVATAIHSANLATIVGPHQRCVSACFLLFAAGIKKLAAPDALIGVHSASVGGGDETLMTMAMTVAMIRAAGAYGVPDAILGKIANTEPGGVQWLTRRDLEAMGVTIMEGTSSALSLPPVEPAPAQPPPPPYLPPPSAPGTPKALEERAKAFMTDFMAQWSADNAVALSFVEQYYGQHPIIYGTPMQHDNLVAFKRSFLERWPVRTYSVQPGSLKATCDSISATCTVDAMVEWHCQSPARRASSSGLSTLWMRLSFVTGEPIVEEEGGAVVARAASP